eukprot:CAMPEP_0202708220 /NCGR_PEP_ID=MMETSP1385-20130828/20460_1 /ASSEMBLY_ACC=CAM_ASM_000861 /TAXON_ID=933848 /ORGANISM="Elphidium margaritaceum" /LENGTH=501 /DNA_ID=CAMNT_0049367145 /DNA_START=463 /DNA_END=1971 /DNA_ORIENTATION=-
MYTDEEEEAVVVTQSATYSTGAKICLAVLATFSCLAVGFLFGLTVPSLLAGIPSNTTANDEFTPLAADANIGNSPPYDVNSSNLTTDEKVTIAEAELLCAEKRCCRQDDNRLLLANLEHELHHDQSALDVKCSELAYLECLSSSNECVWDCHTPPVDSLMFDHRFHGINNRHAHDFGVPRTFITDISNHSHVNLDEQLSYVSMDECGTIYEHHLTASSLAREQATLDAVSKVRVRSHSPPPPESTFVFGGYSSSDFQFVRRRMGAVFGSDGRSDVTSEQYPYTANVYIQHRTNIPGEFARCSGAFISSRHILTAAHCLSDGAGNFYWDFVGVANYNAGRYQVFVDWDEVFVPTQWHFQGDWDYDYAVITVKQEFTLFESFPFAWSTYIDEKWKFDANGYPSDKGFTMQKQDVYMDMAIYYDTMYTQTGDIIEGNSGGPAWYTDDYTIYGIASHTVSINQIEGVPVDPPVDIANGFTRITKTKFDLICAFMQKIPGTYPSCL